MSIPATRPPNQAIRCGDRAHKASIARQRKHATTTPREQAQAIATIIRKRLSDGQNPPDLDKYHLTNAVWTELLDVLSADELTAVADAAGGDDLDDIDDEPTADDITQAFKNDVPFTPEPSAPQQTPAVAHGWHDAFPVHTHSLSWTDSDGISHSHTVRSDDIDDVLRQVKTIKVVIAAAKARDAKTSVPAQTAATDGRQDWCHIHNTPMKQRGDESQGYWYSHKAADGWCRGKAKA